MKSDYVLAKQLNIKFIFDSRISILFTCWHILKIKSFSFISNCVILNLILFSLFFEIHGKVIFKYINLFSLIISNFSLGYSKHSKNYNNSDTLSNYLKNLFFSWNCFNSKATLYESNTIDCSLIVISNLFSLIENTIKNVFFQSL